jgi:hypothetical protein
MKKNLALAIALACTLAMALTSCKSTKYHTCDAYKTHYKALKPERHKSHHHQLCDAYN